MPTKTIKPLRPFFFLREKETKKPALCHLSKGGFALALSFKNQQGTGSIFEKITQKISTFKPLPIFILSVLSSLPKARLSKNKIFIVFRFSSVTDKTTQNKKIQERSLVSFIQQSRPLMEQKI
ncbi:hypothetical protein LOS24_13315 [Enterococcus faecium]|nr:hypothetical protein [Enterococcus faecium]